MLRFGGREWRVVGIFDAAGSAFDSEVWGDADQLMQAFRRQAYSSVVARLVGPPRRSTRSRRGSKPIRGMTLDVKRERAFYEEQSQALSNFISYLGLTLSIIFSIGAMIGAMITMYAAVANRVGEIGTLRALGFRRSAVLAAFLFEAVLLGAIGGVVGVALASFMQLVQHLDAQLAVVRRARVQLHSRRASRSRRSRSRCYGRGRRVPARGARRAAEDRRRAAGGLESGKQ